MLNLLFFIIFYFFFNSLIFSFHFASSLPSSHIILQFDLFNVFSFSYVSTYVIHYTLFNFSNTIHLIYFHFFDFISHLTFSSLSSIPSFPCPKSTRWRIQGRSLFFLHPSNQSFNSSFKTFF